MVVVCATHSITTTGARRVNTANQLFRIVGSAEGCLTLPLSEVINDNILSHYKIIMFVTK